VPDRAVFLLRLLLTAAGGKMSDMGQAKNAKCNILPLLKTKSMSKLPLFLFRLHQVPSRKQIDKKQCAFYQVS